eukprot:10272624-Alexandrium_andersonii.AAC.1
MVDSAKRHIHTSATTSVVQTPKLHLMMHLIAASRKKGAPMLQATFLDESFNGRVAALAQTCHRHT